MFSFPDGNCKLDMQVFFCFAVKRPGRRLLDGETLSPLPIFLTNQNSNFSENNQVRQEKISRSRAGVKRGEYLLIISKYYAI